MKTLGDMKLYSFDEVLDERFGKVGTHERDQFESDVDEAVRAYHIGETIKAERLKHNLTQEQLGERVGVQKAQISRIEKGNNITLPTMRRVFRALGVESATLDLGSAGKLTLW